MIYFIRPKAGGHIKIGTTIRLSQRLAQLAAEFGELQVLAVADGSTLRRKHFIAASLTFVRLANGSSRVTICSASSSRKGSLGTAPTKPKPTPPLKSTPRSFR